MSSIYEYAGDGVTTRFSFPGEYIQSSFVKAYVGEPLVETTAYTFDEVTSEAVFDSPPPTPVGAVNVRLQRQTPADPLVTFNSPGAILKDDLNKINQQWLNRIEEFEDEVEFDAAVDGSITQAKLAKPSVGTPELIDLAITTAKIADDAVTVTKLDAQAANTVLSNNTTSLAGPLAVATDNLTVLADGSDTRRALSARAADVVNVKDFGAVGDGVTDDTAAINAALAAVPNYGTVFVPSGTFLCASQVTTSRNIQFSIVGGGAYSSRLVSSTDVDGSFYFNNQDRLHISGLRFETSGTFTKGNYLLRINSCVDPMIDSVFLQGVRGLIKAESCNFLQMTNVRGESVTGTGGGTCVRLASVGGTISNCYFRVGPFASGGYQDAEPCVHFTGVSTSMKISNCGFGGGGPVSSFAISTITSTASNFTVTTTAAHSFAAGDHVAIRGASVGGYNQSFRITSATSNAFVVTSTLNPGAATGGTAESSSCCVYISNADGAINECQMSNCLMEAGQPNLYGTAGVYIDGNRSTSQVTGWVFSGCYTDFGYTGIAMVGKDAGGGATTVQNIGIHGLKGEGNARGVIVEGSRNISITGYIGQTNQSSAGDFLGDPAGRTADITLAAGNTPYTRGVNISGCQLGMDGAWLTAARQREQGIYFIGEGNAIEDVIVTGCSIFGKQFPLNYDASTVIGTSWTFHSNSLSFGTVGSNYVPTVASGTTTNIYPWYEYMEITGTTNIQFINPGWVGKEIKLLFQGALTLLTGGNLAIAANYNVLAGQLVTLVNNGTTWYIK